MRIHDLVHWFKQLFGHKKDANTKDSASSRQSNSALKAPPVPPAETAPIPEEAKRAQPTVPEAPKPAQVPLPDRLQTQKRKSNATYVKLQALSASGTGTSLTTGDQSEALGALLERLDKDK